MTTGGNPLPPGKEKGPGKSILIYDGECSVCRGAIDWIRTRMSPGTVEFLSCHDDSLPARFPTLDRSACLQAAHLVLPDGRVLSGERAVPELFSRIPGYRWVARLMAFPGARYLSGFFYRRFARRRHAIASLFRSGH